MTDRPIIFSAPMVLALLAGRKTVTRRILKPQPYLDQSGNFCCADRKGKVWNWGQNLDGSPCLRNFLKTEVRWAKGDRLYVRENIIKTQGGIAYAADAGDAFAGAKPKITPCIHMPRAASRMTLLVTGVKVERLQDISEAEAKAEGVQPVCDHGVGNRHLHSIAFEQLWEAINGRGSWTANPWVAAISFDVDPRNIDQIGPAR